MPTAQDTYTYTQESVTSSEAVDIANDVTKLVLAVPYVTIFVVCLIVMSLSFCLHRKRFKKRQHHQKHLWDLRTAEQEKRDARTRRNAITAADGKVHPPRMQALVPYRLDVGLLMTDIQRQSYLHSSSSIESMELGLPNYSNFYRQSSLYTPSSPSPQQQPNRKPAASRVQPQQRRGARVQFKRSKIKRKLVEELPTDASYRIINMTASTVTETSNNVKTVTKSIPIFTAFKRNK